MKALLKNNTWIEIDTTHLFNDQYNTVDGKRIFDKDIKEIVNDARIGMGKCKCCGAMIKKGEEEKHFLENENKTCDGCFWYQDKRVETIKHKPKTTIQEINGEIISITERTETTKYKKVCAYKEKYGDCTNSECRKMGVKWFTPQNTFFLKYPKGVEVNTTITKLKMHGFIVENGRIHAHFYKKLGSYTLEAILHYENGKAENIESFRLWNCRKDYNFIYNNGDLLTNKYAFGWRSVKTLEGVPENVMQSVFNICKALEESEK